jgi:hypothetical protein
VAGRLQVFVNCPFDEQYEPLRDALIFALLCCGANPRLALEESDGAASRAGTIFRLMKKCRLAVHDLSRVGLDSQTGYPRFNMPFELGVFLGLKYSGASAHQNKRCLILDEKNYRYRDYLSDFAGRDIAVHGDDENKLIRAVQDWISAQIGNRRQAPGPEIIIRWFSQFDRKLPEICEEEGYRVEDLSFRRKKWLAEEWIRQKRAEEKTSNAGGGV